MNTTTQLTQALDLTPNELKVYEGFVKNPGVSAAKMSSLLGMDKSSTYRSVANLVTHDLLVPVPTNDTMTYKAADPEIIKEIFSNKLASFKNLEGQVNSFVSSLVSASSRKTHIRTEVGVSAAIRAMKESLLCQEKVIREMFFDLSIYQDPEYFNFVNKYITDRAAKNIWIHQYISKERLEAISLKALHHRMRKTKKVIRLLPEELSDMNTFRVWDNTVNFLSEDNNKEVLVITITDHYVASFMKRVYDFIWEQCKPV